MACAQQDTRAHCPFLPGPSRPATALMGLGLDPQGGIYRWREEGEGREGRTDGLREGGREGGTVGWMGTWVREQVEIMIMDFV